VEPAYPASSSYPVGSVNKDEATGGSDGIISTKYVQKVTKPTE
jgi:hypothetical protein